MTLPDQNKIQQYNADLLFHTAPLFGKLGITANYNLSTTTSDDINHIIDALAAICKRNVENNPYLSTEQKETLQHQYDVQADGLKQLNKTFSQCK